MKLNNYKFLLMFLFSSGLYADGYDRCKDILRDGVRDTLSNNSSMQKKVADHLKFCNKANEHNLSEGNFDSFARDYAKSEDSHGSSVGAGGKVGYGPFSLEANYSQSSSEKKLSESEKEALLKTNSQIVMDYYHEKCSDRSYEESLKMEANAFSQIANPAIIAAWRDCMVQQVGLFAELQSHPQSDGDYSEHHVLLRWISHEGTEINSIRMRYSENVVISPYPIENTHGGWVKTQNICEHEGCVLKSHGTLPLTISHINLNQDASLSIIALSNTGVSQTHIIVLPKKFTPEKTTLQLTSAEQLFALGVNYYGALNGCPKDITKAAEFYRLAGQEGHARALLNLGLIYFQGFKEIPKNHNEAKKLFEKAAALGNVLAIEGLEWLSR